MKTPTPHGISVEVVAEFVSAQSNPGDEHYAFAYHVTIRNTGPAPARLISRHWVITDGAGHVHEIHGQGVIGEQPRLVPGEVFHYSSSCVLETPVGTMQGHYLMETDQGQKFEAEIPAFMLAMPRVLH
ncbi:MAG: Co2+/Mg2+ efflux protein ApaG [Azoarcus sp.]|nr:Co2+/Mg2+ efflux protein ApaG [Azoarcus sp.]